jgi:hypothetical protein
MPGCVITLSLKFQTTGCSIAVGAEEQSIMQRHHAADVWG